MANFQKMLGSNQKKEISLEETLKRIKERQREFAEKIPGIFEKMCKNQESISVEECYLLGEYFHYLASSIKAKNLLKNKDDDKPEKTNSAVISQ